MNTNDTYEEDLYEPIPGSDPDPVGDTTKEPYRNVGLLRMTFPNNKTYIGTGTVIAIEDEKNSYYVLTCAHNLFDSSDGGEVKKVEFLRAYNDPKQPFTAIAAKIWHYPAGYPKVAVARTKEHDFLQSNHEKLEAEISLDYGIVELISSVDSTDGFPTIVVKTKEDLLNLAVQINGYGFFGKKMSHVAGPIKEVGDTYLRYPLSTKKGASGSAIATANGEQIVGIHTRAYNAKFNQGVRITESVKKEILKWMGK